MGYTTSLGFTPLFQITKDGDDITDSFSDRLVSITVTSVDGGGESDTVDILLDDRDWVIAIPNVGENSGTLHVFLGYKESQLNDCGTFNVGLVDLSFSAKSMLIHGNSVGTNTALKAPAITSFDQSTVGDIVGKLAFLAGVTPQVDPKIGALEVQYLNQHGTSGNQLRSLESRFGALAKISDGNLSFTQRGTGESVSGQSIGSVTLDGADISDLKITINNKNSYSKVRASYWDKDQHKLNWLQSAVPGDSA